MLYKMNLFSKFLSICLLFTSLYVICMEFMEDIHGVVAPELQEDYVEQPADEGGGGFFGNLLPDPFADVRAQMAVFMNNNIAIQRNFLDAGNQIRGEVQHGFEVNDNNILRYLSRSAGEMVVAFAGSIKDSVGGKKLGAIAATVILLPVVMYSMKSFIDYVKQYYIVRLNTPQLVKKILYPWQISRNISDFHYTGEINKQIQNVISTAKLVAKEKDEDSFWYKLNPYRDKSRGRAKYQNVLLWGPSGVGKTAVAEIIAKQANMLLFMISAADFAKLRGKDIEQVDKVIEEVRASSRPILLFIDRLENLFGSRAQKEVPEENRRIFSKLLEDFSEPNNQVMLVGATSEVGNLDEATLNRMPKQIQITYPDEADRREIIKIYVKSLFKKDTAYSEFDQKIIAKIFDEQRISDMARRVGNISPVEIQNIMVEIKNNSLMNTSLTYVKGVPTLNIINEAINNKIKQLNAQKKGSARRDIDMPVTVEEVSKKAMNAQIDPMVNVALGRMPSLGTKVSKKNMPKSSIEQDYVKGADSKVKEVRKSRTSRVRK